MSLDERAFSFLYVHVNLLADLAFTRALRALELEIAEESGEEPPEDDAIDLERLASELGPQRARLRRRIACAYASADRARLSALLARLSPDLAPLTGPLGAADLRAWLERCEPGGESDLADLIAELRGVPGRERLG